MEHYYRWAHLEHFVPKTLYLDVTLICDLYLYDSGPREGGKPRGTI